MLASKLIKFAQQSLLNPNIRGHDWSALADDFRTFLHQDRSVLAAPVP